MIILLAMTGGMLVTASPSVAQRSEVAIAVCACRRNALLADVRCDRLKSPQQG
jgi:hypothetical protein